MTDKITVYITKKLFTQGIIKTQVDIKNIEGLCCQYGRAIWVSASNNCSIERNKEWFLSLKEAEDNARLRLEHEIAKVKNKLRQLENMKTFKIREEK